MISAAQRSDVDELMREEALLALQTLLRIGIDRGDLLPGDVTAALDMARAGKFRQSSPHLAESLAEYQSVHLPV